jgi:hypothetical protein
MYRISLWSAIETHQSTSKSAGSKGKEPSADTTTTESRFAEQLRIQNLMHTYMVATFSQVTDKW